MTDDTLCPCYRSNRMPTPEQCQCELIARVRKETLAAAVQRVEEQAAIWQAQTLTRLGIGIALAAINKGQS